MHRATNLLAEGRYLQKKQFLATVQLLMFTTGLYYHCFGDLTFTLSAFLLNLGHYSDSAIVQQNEYLVSNLPTTATTTMREIKTSIQNLEYP